MRKLINKTNSIHRGAMATGAIIALALGSTVACSSVGDDAATKHQLQTTAWASGVSYSAGDLVSYDGASYSCIQAHTSLTGWEPPNVPALWEETAGGTGGEPSSADCESDPASCCPEGSTVLELTQNADVFQSFSPDRCVLADAGNDTIYMQATGNSALILGPGDDTAMSGPGNDLIIGGSGRDTINAFGGTNTFFAGPGDDTIMAANGTNTVYPGPGVDTVALGTGDDTLHILDTCEVANGSILDGGTGTDTLHTPISVAELQGMGVVVSNFENIVIDATRGCYSECSVEVCETTSTVGDAPSVVPSPTTSAPPFDGVDDLDAFLSWFYGIRRADLPEVRTAIESVSNSAPVAAGIVQRFQTTRANRDVGKSLMLLVLLGAMESPSAEQALIDLVEEPLSGADDDSFATSRFDNEVIYRRRALFNLSGRSSAAAEAAIEDAALNHAEQRVRGAALRVLSFGATSAERDTLLSQVQPGDEIFVERPNRTDPDFETRYQAVEQKYAQ